MRIGDEVLITNGKNTACDAVIPASLILDGFPRSINEKTLYEVMEEEKMYDYTLLNQIG